MGTASKTTAWVPSQRIVGYVQRMLAARYQLQPADVEDLISQAFLDCLQTHHGERTSSDGLFLVVVRRRVADFWRHQKLEHSMIPGPSSSPPDREHLESVLLERALLQFARGKTQLERERLVKAAMAAIESGSFTDACRTSGIPRGSQGRYRETLKAFLRYLERRRSRGHTPSH